MTKTRASRTGTSSAEVRQQLQQDDAKSMATRVRRYRRLSRLFPIDGGLLIMGGEPAWLALHEMWRSYLSANYLAVVLCAQVFIEHSLAVHHILSGDDSTAEAGFAKLIDEARSTGAFSAARADRMHRLRRMRNPYVHPRAYSRPRNYMERIVESGFKSSIALLESDAEFALETVAEFMGLRSRKRAG
jgi:cytochrome P450